MEGILADQGRSLRTLFQTGLDRIQNKIPWQDRFSTTWEKSSAI